MPLSKTKDAVDWAAAFRDAAIADGWSHGPTYKNHEPEERAARLEREGFVISVLTRDNVGVNKLYEGSVTIWCPRGIQVTPPMEYSWEKVVAGTRICDFCKKEDTDTHRVGFANRSCGDCLAEARKKLEKPGWTD